MSIVITAYGHNKTIDKIAVNSFEGPENRYTDQKSDAKTYCDTINALELKGDSWVCAKIFSENTQYSLDVFIPLNFSDVIIKLDNIAVQKVLREADSQDLAMSLRDQDETVKEKVFINMSKRVSEMLKEDMEYMGKIKLQSVKESQEKILNIIRRLEQCEEIVIPDDKGELV
jgi:flagellar motor switch protein FliG